MATTYCLPPNSPAYNLVGYAQEKFMNLGDRTYKMVEDSLGTLDNVGLDPVEFNISFDFGGQLTPFNRPSKPAFSASDFEIRVPGDVSPPPVFLPGIVAGTEAPALDAQEPSLSFGVKPQRPVVAMPKMPAMPAELDFPDLPNYSLPALPSFEQINLPSLPDIDLPQFSAALPELVEPPFDDSWSFQPTVYASELKGDLEASIKGMLQAKAALPEHIEAAIFQKGRSRIDIETAREVDQLLTDFAGRGFNVPTGMMTAQIRDVRQRGQDRIAEFNRDAVVKQYEETLQNLRIALSQGAALEGVYINLHVEEQRFALEAARYSRESTIAVLQYRLSVFQARMQGYQIQAQVLRDRIQAELAKVELFRAQLEGERVRGEINEQRVRLYAEQIRSVNMLADFYRTQVEAVKVKADAQRLTFDAYKTAMDGFDSLWRAHVAEWQGYTAGVEGESKRVDVFRTLVDAQAKRVDAWKTGEEMRVDRERLRIQQYGQQLDGWRALLSKREADLATERARLGAVASRSDAEARMYTAEASVEQAASAANDRSFELGLARSRSVMEAGLKNVELKTQQAQWITAQAMSINDTKLKIGAQLAASSWSAVNYSAGVSASVSQSSGCSTNFSFNGEISDA